MGGISIAKNKLKLPVALWLIGAFFIAADAVVFGRYTGVPNTYFGWIGSVFLCLVIFPLILNAKGGTELC